MISRRVGYLCWLLGLAVLYFFENNTGTRAVLLTSVAVPAFSVVCAAWTAKKASCSLLVPESAEKGKRVSCRCVLFGPWTKVCCTLSCRIRAEHLMTHETGAREISGEETFSINCAHCGTLQILADEVNARDWLGLTRFPCKASGSGFLLILPDLYPVRVELSPVLSAFQREERPGLIRRDGPESENGGVRDYAPGDPVRRIHWKLSAKTDQILIREEEQPLAGTVLLLLETSGYGVAPQDMDAAAEGLLSVSMALTEEGAAHSVSWQDGGELQWREIACAEDFLAMRHVLLASKSEEAGESIGAAFSRAYPDFRADQAVVFSPRPDTDCVSLREIGSVFLALPRREAGSTDVPAVCVSREEPELSL